jgi:hypothetical protein
MPKRQKSNFVPIVNHLSILITYRESVRNRATSPRPSRSPSPFIQVGRRFPVRRVATPGDFRGGGDVDYDPLFHHDSADAFEPRAELLGDLAYETRVRG